MEKGNYAQRFAANRSGCLNKTSIYKPMLMQPFLLGAVISCKNYDLWHKQPQNIQRANISMFKT